VDIALALTSLRPRSMSRSARTTRVCARLTSASARSQARRGTRGRRSPQQIALGHLGALSEGDTRDVALDARADVDGVDGHEAAVELVPFGHRAVDHLGDIDRGRRHLHARTAALAAATRRQAEHGQHHPSTPIHSSLPGRRRSGGQLFDEYRTKDVLVASTESMEQCSRTSPLPVVMPPIIRAKPTRRSAARPRVAAEPKRRELVLEKVLAALADPTRLGIVQYLERVDDEVNCAACSCPERSKSTMAHHFKVLREAGVLGTREVGTQIMNHVRRDDLDARFPGLLDAVLNAAPPLRL
jgi:DNA-binding transcriptional ArsR family regulator